ncbi:hypothetical protein DFJ74DRAFT_662590 [Hyaloraphidium curvatum]|nr:hypothetical protein DFJ74DRAFT_662590 [Hyaloraphidium curvatum]
MRVHAVSRTDTLAGLSLLYGVPADAILRANGLWSRDSIHARRQLAIPAPAVPGPAAATPAPAPPAPPAPASPPALPGSPVSDADPWADDDGWLLEPAPLSPAALLKLDGPRAANAAPPSLDPPRGRTMQFPRRVSKSQLPRAPSTPRADQASDDPRGFFDRIDGDVTALLGRLFEDYGRDIARQAEEADDPHRPSLKRLQKYAVDVPWPGTQPRTVRVAPSLESLNGGGRRLRRPPSEMLEGRRPADYFDDESPRRHSGSLPRTAPGSPLRATRTDELAGSFGSVRSLGKAVVAGVRLSLDGMTRPAKEAPEAAELKSLPLRSMYGAHVSRRADSLPRGGSAQRVEEAPRRA